MVEDQLGYEGIGGLVSVGFDATDEVWVGMAEGGHQGVQRLLFEGRGRGRGRDRGGIAE